MPRTINNQAQKRRAGLICRNLMTIDVSISRLTRSTRLIPQIQRAITIIILCFSLHFIIVLSDALIATARVAMFWSEEGESVDSAEAVRAVKKLNTRLLNSFYQALVLAAVTGFLIIGRLTRRTDYYAVAATMNVCRLLDGSSQGRVWEWVFLTPESFQGIITLAFLVSIPVTFPLWMRTHPPHSARARNKLFLHAAYAVAGIAFQWAIHQAYRHERDRSKQVMAEQVLQRSGSSRRDIRRIESVA